MRTHCEYDGVGPSRMKSWCQPGGETFALGGAVMKHTFRIQLNSGNITRPPIALPCVDEVADEIRHQ